MPDDVSELQKEWRAIVLEKLSSLEEVQQYMRTDIVDIKTSFAKQQAFEEFKIASRADIDSMRDKIDELNAFKYKLIGISVVINLILGFIVEYVIFHGK